MYHLVFNFRYIMEELALKSEKKKRRRRQY